MKPEISVVIPVYNVERFLPACMESLLQQTFQNIEFIFVNDASPDHCIDLLHEQEKMHPGKVHVVNLEKNRCQGGARNAGIACAQGKYIGFVDGDDFVAPYMYECLYKKMQETEADAVFIQYAAVPANASLYHLDTLINPLIMWHEELLRWDNKSLHTQECGIDDILAYPIGGIYCGLYRSELLTQHELPFPEHLRYEDNYWMTLLKCYMSKIAFVQKVCYYYRQNQNSTVHSNNKHYHFDRIQIEQMLLAEVKKRGFYEAHYKAWEYIYTFRYAVNSYMMFLTKFSPMPKEQLQKVVQDLRREFPEWERNTYYQELTTKKQKFINRIIIRFPILFAYLYKIVEPSYKILRRFVKR